MKTIEKKSLERVISLTRAIGDSDLKRIDLLIADRVMEAKHLTRNIELDWLSVLDLVDSILRYQGLQPEAGNDVIYDILFRLGWAVV